MTDTNKDKARLRNLAGKYAEYAHGKPMAQRREKWRLHNRLQEKTVPFHIEDQGTFHRDLMPPLECENPGYRGLEAHLLYAITSYEKIDDDRIIPDRFVVDWHTPVTPMCEELEYTRAASVTGVTSGYKTNKPIKNLDADFGKLKRRTISLDRENTERRAQLAREIFEGLLPVEIGRTGTFYSHGITNAAVSLMGMQEMYTEMTMNPEGIHRLFNFIGEDNYALGQWEEDQNLLTLNHDGNQGYCSGSSLYSDETSKPAGDRVVSTDRYGYFESQESVGISAGMFEEFVLPHFLKRAKKFKLVKWGCCEPIHNFIDLLQRAPNLRKASVTPWCDMRKLAESCRPDVIWCRKPIPLILCGDTFSPDEMRAHLKEALDIGQDYFVEFVYRDTDLLTGKMVDRVAQTCAIIRELSGHPEGSRGS